MALFGHAAISELSLLSGVERSALGLRNLHHLAEQRAGVHVVERGRRVGVLTNAGGLGILCADACATAGLELPELSEETRSALRALLPDDASVANPVDLLGSATGATFESVIPPLLEDKRLDALIVLFVPPVVAGAEEVATAIHDAVARPRRRRVVSRRTR